MEQQMKFKWYYVSIGLTIINYIAYIFGAIDWEWYYIIMPLLVHIGIITIGLISLIFTSVILYYVTRAKK
jgi:hypothetical protein